MFTYISTVAIFEICISCESKSNYCNFKLIEMRDVIKPKVRCQLMNS